ncbi:MAG TPA: PTS sugar transporter subunit IIA [Chlorobaculum sp.]|nr:PTS sugar transporter subunit IIA [Chlorobaculum sp.]
MDENRADSFLRLIQRSQRGRLKIYLGYCAGVGKTFQMLLEAKRLRDQGIDVVVGIVETHGRKETEALLENLDIIPRKTLTYRGIEITEMDIDAIIKRHPAVVMVDELAHTNVPGSRNAKRYQDVEEILASGIHVVSTLNVQHLESLYETVEHATGVRVKERLPDRVVLQADQLVNVDIATDDLLQRLKEGKVYLAGKAESALTNFFRQENLEQLRELTLREVAAQIDSNRRAPLQEEQASSPDQVMVCLSSKSENSAALLRYASRIAGRLNRNWYAVYVQSLSERPEMIDAGIQRKLSNSLALAQQLGATVFIYKGDDIVSTVLQFAREYRVGHIVVGNSGERLSLLHRLTGKCTMVERLMQESQGITIVVPDIRQPVENRKKLDASKYLSGIRETLMGRQQAPDDREASIFHANVLIWNEVLEKDTAIRQLLDTICRTHSDVPFDYAWRAIMEREKQGATFIGEEIAIPHARLEGIESTVLAVGVSKLGIYDAGSNNTATIMFLMLSPVSRPDSHVKLLGMLSKMAGDSQWRAEMRKAGSEMEVMQILRHWIEGNKKR